MTIYKRKISDANEFITKAQQNKRNFDYSKVIYIDSKTKVEIICLVHGSFWQRPNHHLCGRGCPTCGIISVTNSKRDSKNEFVQKANIEHDSFYNYDKTIYVNARSKVIITCPFHGIFEQTPNQHLSGHGCHICRSSSGEQKIVNHLKHRQISYARQVSFEGCKYRRKLLFDFGITNLTGKLAGLVEFNGLQHYKIINFYGGKSTFHKIQSRDAIKEEYCRTHKIPLLIIPYDKIKDVNVLTDMFLKKIGILT